MDGKSVMSASSLGSVSSAADARNSLHVLQEQPKNRKFVTTRGQIGNAKEAREAVSKLINMRTPPISNALDYESFMTEFGSDLENDPLRDLLLFPRDDLALLKACTEELNAAEKVSGYFASPSTWQISRDSIQYFSTPCSVIKFNYERFFGDCEKYIASSGLNELVFEQIETVDSMDKDSLSPVGVLKEGYLMVDLHADNFVRNLKGRKRRYCVIKRNQQNRISVELMKQQDASVNKMQFTIESAHLKTSNKQRMTILELLIAASTSQQVPEQCLLFPSDTEPDIKPWFAIIDHALKNSAGHFDSLDEKTSEPSLSETTSESLTTTSIITDNYRVSRRPSTIESLLKPPLVKRKNVFCLYNNVEPICRPSGETSALLEDQENDTYKVCNPENKPFANSVDDSGTSFDLRHCHSVAEDLVTVTVESDLFKIHVKWEESSEQIEPFFLRMFLFDLQSGQRISEELSFTVATNEYAQLIQANSPNGKNKICIFGTNIFNLKAIFKLTSVNSNFYIVIRVERLLSCPSDIYLKSHLDKKQLIKNAKMVNSAYQRLTDYRTIFAWTARPLQVPANSSQNELSFFRVDGRLSDAELKKYLSDFNKLQKSGKIQLIPNATMNLSVKLNAENVEVPLKQLDTLVTTDLYSAVSNKTIYAEPFSIASDPVKALRICTNFLYIYPQQLNYGSQKNFSRARNIVCSVSLIRLKNSQLTPHRCFLDLANLNGPRVESINCALQYHEQNPMFSDELKFELPLDLNEGDHLLFKFLHISLANAQKVQSSEPVEQNVGFAWVPLVSENGLFLSQDIQEFDLPVASALTPDYFTYDSANGHLKKNIDNTSLKWVENGKPLFKVRFRLKSALLSSNKKLNQFFQNCSDTVDDTEWLMESTDQNLFEGVSFDQILFYLHILLNRLIQMFTRTGTLGFSGYVLRKLINLVDTCVENGRKQELREFVRFHCVVAGEFDTNSRLLYEGIMESIGLLFSNKKVETATVIKTLKHLWFVLDVCVKSMAQTIVLNGSHKISRRKRYSAFTSDSMQTMFSEAAQQIVQHYRQFPAECRAGNVALAYFAKYALNLTDRGVVFGIIFEFIRTYDLVEAGFPRRYKLEFLQLLASHEHWIPLNVPVIFNAECKPIFNLQLNDHSIGSEEFRVAKSALKPTGLLSRIFSQFMPLSIGSNVSSKKSVVTVDNFQLSKSYCQLHFLLGLLIQEFSMALHESRAYRRLVITLVRNLLVKHSSDVRYENAIAQNRIAVLYAPLISVILENIGEFELVHRFEPRDTQQTADDQRKFDYPQASARSVISKDTSLFNSRPNDVNGTQKIAQFAEKLDMDEAKDLILCCLYLLSNLPKSAIVALSFNFPDSFVSIDADNFPIIQLLKLAIRLFRCRDKNNMKVVTNQQSKKISLTVRDIKATSSGDRSLKILRKTMVQDAHLAQEVALICLEVTHALAEHVASRWNTNDTNSTTECQIFNGLVKLKLDLVGEDWPEGVRLHALNSLGMFIELFSAQFASNHGADALSRLTQRLLFFLNSRLERVQAATAALLHLLIRQGFDNTIELYKTQTLNSTDTVQDLDALNYTVTAEWLGNPGVQIISSVANLLGQNELSADCSNFEQGLRLFESLAARPVDRKSELFQQAAQDLTDQIRDIFKATISISSARNDPIRLAELHIQLANNYRGSPALRIAWFDTLAQLQLADRWLAEAAVCHAHSVAIIAKQLMLRDGLKIDFSLLNAINKQIVVDEHINGPELPAAQSSKFTVEALTTKVEETMKILIQAERYEACGQLCRLIIPIHEQQANHKALISLYADLSQAHSRAFEIQKSGKRHLATYFRIILYSPIHFREEHQVEYIYREPGLTSLAEASERMVQIFRRALGTDQVRFLTDLEIDSKSLDPKVANIQLTYVEPLCLLDDSDLTDFNTFQKHLQRMQTPEMNYWAHTNVQYFFYEKPLVLPQPANQNEKISEQARLALRRVFLKTKESFPNSCRRLKVVKQIETTLNPLVLACENLQKKAAQIQRILTSAGIPATGSLDKCKVHGVDVKGLQLILQGSVSPTVNVGVLAYAEAFCSDSQRLKYGSAGIEKLKEAFRIFISQLARALVVNNLAIGPDQSDYQIMLKNSFDGMIERLSTFFDGENFLPDLLTPITSPKSPSVTEQSEQLNCRNSTYILDSISGLNRS